MHILGMILLGLAGLALEATLMPALKMAGVKPDLLLVILTLYAFLNGAPRGAALGFTYGLLEDLFTGKLLGLNALTKMVTGYLVGLTVDTLNRDNVLVASLLAFLATFCQGTLVLLLGRLVGWRYPWLAGWTAVILPMALYNGCLALLGYIFYKGRATRDSYQ